MTREEAQRECTRLASESPDRETHTFLPREEENGEWAVVKVAVAPVTKPTGTSKDHTERPPADVRQPMIRNIPPYGAG